MYVPVDTLHFVEVYFRGMTHSCPQACFNSKNSWFTTRKYYAYIHPRIIKGRQCECMDLCLIWVSQQRFNSKYSVQPTMTDEFSLKIMLLLTRNINLFLHQYIYKKKNQELITSLLDKSMQQVSESVSLKLVCRCWDLEFFSNTVLHSDELLFNIFVQAKVPLFMSVHPHWLFICILKLAVIFSFFSGHWSKG